MFGSYEGAMVDAAAAPQVGCRTLCQHPGCGRPIELIPPLPPDDHPVWAHVLVGTWVGPDHEANPVEPEPDVCPLHGPGCWRTTVDGRTEHHDGQSGQLIASYPEPYTLPEELSPTAAEQLVSRVQDSVDTYQRAREETLTDFAAFLSEKAGTGVDEFSAALRQAARWAERRAGGES